LDLLYERQLDGMENEFNLQAFSDAIAARKKYVDSCLRDWMGSRGCFPPLIHEAMHYAVFNGGKRLRPIMVMEGARLAGKDPDMVIPSACALEMLHSYSLVHDDLPAMDDDDFRRGKPTCHKVFGEANAILTGDALLTAAFEIIARNADVDGVESQKVIRVIREVAEAAGSQGMIGGQVMDLEAEGRRIDYETLRTLHSLKTGRLFRASLRAGAILAGMDESGLEALSNYAEHFGLAFQISDDILDVQGDEKLIGKPVGSDEKNHKTTYPSLFGMDKAQQLLRESAQGCLKALEHFGPEADFLRNLAIFTVVRRN